jgi:predicted CXXCH cytochrome family protein
MKKFIVLTVALVFMSTSAFAIIAGSSHDFNGWAPQNQTCAPCHTPHNAISTSIPLWAHTTTAETFTNYTSSTMNGTSAVGAGSISQACLSCHDGETAMDSFVGGPAVPSVVMGAVTGNLGTALGDDHPIGFDYAAVQVIEGAGGLNAAISLPLFGGNLECATCHDVHNQTAFPSMLNLTLANSALCTECHVK